MAPASIQHIKVFIWAWVMVPLCGIVPASIAALIFDFFANTSACVVNGPPELVLPLAWQLLLIEQTVVSIGCISVENFGLIPTHENVIPPPPPPVPPPGAASLLLHAVNTETDDKIRRVTIDIFLMTGIFKPYYLLNVYSPQ